MLNAILEFVFDAISVSLILIIFTPVDEIRKFAKTLEESRNLFDHLAHTRII